MKNVVFWDTKTQFKRGGRGYGTALQAERSRVQDPMTRIISINLSNRSDHTRPWGLIIP
jgi:hypothetical protein